MSYQISSTLTNQNYSAKDEFIIKKSRFIAYAYAIDSKEALSDHLKEVQALHPDARHICYGYIIGDPNNTTCAGFDDAGEPNGTAGRPILNVLQHKLIGNCVIFVVRYFGGIKLGAGGLTRAYSTAAQLAIDGLTLARYIPKKRIILYADFANEAQIRYLVRQACGDILAVDYAKQVRFLIHIAQDSYDTFAEEVARWAQIEDPQNSDEMS